MCQGCDSHAGAVVSAPRPAHGTAIDPIELEPIDEVVITTLVDNSYDALIAPTTGIQRTGLNAVPAVEADHFTGGTTAAGMVAEHGFSALVTTRRGQVTHTVLFDTGVSPQGM